MRREFEGLDLPTYPTDEGGIRVGFGAIQVGPLGHVDGQIAGGRTKALRGIDASDGRHISEAEAQIRIYIFELAQFWRRYIPGFESSYLMYIAPFLGNRGGDCIDGDYVVTHDDVSHGRRFSDNLFIFTPSGGNYTVKPTDFPYRAMLPKTIDGLIAVGRCASGKPDTLLRGAHMAPHMGEAGGLAAAMAAGQGIEPRDLDVRSLQKALLDAGFYLGEPERLAELDLR
jgi:hypothetical protein